MLLTFDSVELKAEEQTLKPVVPKRRLCSSNSSQVSTNTDNRTNANVDLACCLCRT